MSALILCNLHPFLVQLVFQSASFPVCLFGSQRTWENEEFHVVLPRFLLVIIFCLLVL